MPERQRSRFVGKLIARAAASCPGGIACLCHEVTQNPMERRAVVKPVACQDARMLSFYECETGRCI